MSTISKGTSHLGPALRRRCVPSYSHHHSLQYHEHHGFSIFAQFYPRMYNDVGATAHLTQAHEIKAGAFRVWLHVTKDKLHTNRVVGQQSRSPS